MNENEVVANHEDIQVMLEARIGKLEAELKEREAEKVHYLKENAFLKEALRRIIGT